MAYIQKLSKSVSNSEEEIPQVSQIPQIPIDFLINNNEEKYKKEVDKSSQKELKKKIEHLKNVLNENNINKDIMKSLDNVLNEYDNSIGDGVISPGISSPPSLSPKVHKKLDDYDMTDTIHKKLDDYDDITEDESESEEEYIPPLEDDSQKNDKYVSDKYYEAKKIDVDFLKSVVSENGENNKDFVDIEINTDGVDHDLYASLSFKSRMKMGKSIGFCETCNKYYPDFIVVEHDGMPYCWHCLFWLTSTSMFGDKELEQTYGLSPEKYIEFCGPTHNKAECIRSAECILCSNCPPDALLVSDGEESTEDFEDLVLELDI